MSVKHANNAKNVTSVMTRLLDMPASSPLLEQAQRLLEAAAPVDDSTEQMLRVRRALDRPAARGAILRAPAFVLGGALVVFGASAFAAVRVWVEHRTPREVPEQRSGVPAQPSSPEALAPRVESPVPQPAAAEPQPSAREPETAVAVADPSSRVHEENTPRVRSKHASKANRVRRTRARVRETRHVRRAASPIAAVAPVQASAPAMEAPEVASAQAQAPKPAPAYAPAVVRTQPEPERIAQPRAADSEDVREDGAEPEVATVAAKRSSDSELVVRAVRALRRDHDPEAASRLLARYRSRNPSGVLAEEVLSLQIEAALAAKDARAASFAREYLSRYPGGRYQARAQIALSGRSP